MPSYPFEIPSFLLIPANDILGRKNEIKNCIAASEMDRAVKRLIDFVRDFHPTNEDIAVMISMDYCDWLKEYKDFEVKCKDGKRLKPNKVCDEKHGTLIMNKKHIVLRIFSTLNSPVERRAQA